MDNFLAGVFLDYAARKLEQLSGRIQDCLGRLPEGELWRRRGGHENAAGNLILHLRGNARQWIGYAVGGLADIRERDLEFAARGGLSKADLAGKSHHSGLQANLITGEDLGYYRHLSKQGHAEKTP